MLKTTKLKESLKFQVAVFVLLRTLLNTTVRMVYPFLPVFGRGLGVDLGIMSRAVSLRSASGVLGPFLATIADTKGRKTGMLLGLSLFTVGMALIIIWPTYPTFVVMLVLSMLGIFAFLPSMQAYLGDRVPYRRRGFVLALTEFSWSLAFILGIPIIGFLLLKFGWRSVFPLFTAAGVFGTGILWWMLPKQPVDSGQAGNIWKMLGQVFSYTPALAGIVIGFGISAANELVNIIFGVWLESSFGVQVAALAAAAVVIGVSELGGEALVGGTTDRIGKRRAVALGLLLNSIVAVALPAAGASLVGALVGLFFFYMTFEYTIVSSIPLMTELLPAARATMMAAFISATSLGRALGDLLAPSLYEVGVSNQYVSGIFFIVAGVLFFNATAGIALWVMNARLGKELALE